MCKKRGRYDPSKSSSAKDPDLEGSRFQYGDFTTATVNYVQDKIQIGGT
jgi:hypothetical protein